MYVVTYTAAEIEARALVHKGQAAYDLGIKIGTFKSRLNRARKLIKKYEDEQ